MDGLIDDFVQVLGYFALQIVSAGRYGRVRPRDPLLFEGAVGFGLIIATMSVIYKVVS